MLFIYVSASAVRSALATKAATVKYLPEWLPGAGFKRMAKAARARAEHMASVPFKHVKREVVRLLSTWLRSIE
jgi:hypothetical protein